MVATIVGRVVGMAVMLEEEEVGAVAEEVSQGIEMAMKSEAAVEEVEEETMKELVEIETVTGDRHILGLIQEVGQDRPERMSSIFDERTSDSCASPFFFVIFDRVVIVQDH